MKKPRQKRQKKTGLINLDKEIEENNAILIEGEMGAGKSKLIRNIIDKLSTAQSYIDSSFLPIYTTYKILATEFNGDLDDCVKKHLGPSYATLDLEKTTFLFLIDGIDEVLENDDRNLETLESILTELNARRDLKAVLTTRPQKLIENEAGLHRLVSRYSIRPLSTKKLMVFVEQICKELNTSKRLIEDIKKSSLFKQLPRNPIAAILLSNLLADNERELPSNLTELYSKSIELMLGRWDIDKGMFTQKEYQATEKICCQLASYVIDNGLNQVSSIEAKNMFKDYLDTRNLGLNHEDLFEKVVSRTGVLAEDKENRTVFFKHRSFAEFLYAKHRFDTTGLEINQRAFEVYWLNTYFFYLGLKKDCPELLQEIISLPATTEAERWSRIINMANYFQAAYSSPYNVVEDNLPSLFAEAAQLFSDIRKGNTETKLATLPEISVLWVFQYLMRDSYSYDYFKLAIETATIQLDDSLIEHDAKMFGLFFLSLIGLDLEEELPLKFLIEKYGIERLPASISVALRAESDAINASGHSILLKKHNKKFKKILKGNRSFSALLKDLFDKPITQTKEKHLN